MAEFFVPGLINVLLERLAPQDAILKYCGGKEEFMKQIEKLRSTPSCKTMLEKYAEKLLTHKEVKLWFVELQEVYTKVAYLLDDIDYHLQPKSEDESATTFRKSMNSISSTFVSPFEIYAIDEIKDIGGMVDLLLKKQNLIGFPTTSFYKLPPPLAEDACGREDDEKKILEFLSSAQEPSMICIVGMCGVGKTTLAQLVYNNMSVDDFPRRAWVAVNENSDFKKIVISILGEVTGNQPTTEDNDHNLQCALVKALTGKKFLCVLDNCWQEHFRFWNLMKNLFKSCAPGSKIIVTTCSKIVHSKMRNAAMLELHPIPDDDCLKIFAERVFPEHVDLDMHPELKRTGMEIVKKCKGLPLAVKSLAGVMPAPNLRKIRQTQQEWGEKLESDIWQLMFEENLQSNILPDLWPSYKELPSVLKRCLAFCSIFPKGYEFRKSDREKIILLWMAQGFLEPENGKRKEDLGKEYLEALISKSFFQNSSHRGKQDIVMHDFVHDLAMRVSLEFCFYCGDPNDLSKLGNKSCHLSYRKGSDVLMKLSGPREPKRSLHTLLALPLSSGGNNQVLETSILENLFQKEECLRILSLPGSSAAEIPGSIAKLKYSRYIDFSGTQVKRLPDSICDLLKLQILVLSGCDKLEELPSRLAALKLLHLDIRGTSSLKKMPPQMYKMESLQGLSDFVLGKYGGCRIKELGQLKYLGGSLCIRGLENIVSVSHVDAANLKYREFLTELILIWKSDSEVDSSCQKDVLNALKPHTNLKQLTIEGYRDTDFPNWVGHASTSYMDEVRLIRCKNCVTLPPFLRESCLKILEIKCCEKLWENRRNWGLQSLSSLESLRLCEIGEEVDSLPEQGLLPTTLTELFIVDFEKLKGLNSRAFQDLTSLQRLKIRGCPELECLPEGLPHSLSCLIIKRCPQLVQRCHRGTGDDWPKIQHIPNIYIDGSKI